MNIIRIGLVLLMVLNLKTGSAQPNREIDSLLQLANKAEQDSQKVNLLNKLGNFCINSNRNDEASSYLNEALELAKKIEYKIGMANAYFNFGALYQASNLTDALKNLEASLQIMQDIGYKAGTAKAYGAIGLIYFNQGKNIKAIENFKPALDYSRETGDKLGVARNAHNIGLCYSQIGKYPEALSHSLEALKMCVELEHKMGMATCYNTIAGIHFDQGNNSESIKGYLKELELGKSLGDKSLMFGAYTGLGLNYKDLRDFQKALENFEEASKMAEGLKNRLTLATSYINLGMIYGIKGKLEGIEGMEEIKFKYYMDALKILEELDDKRGLIVCYDNIARYYEDKNQYDKAYEYFIKSLSLAEEQSDIYGISTVYFQLTCLEEARGNYQEALANLRLAGQYKDSSWNESKSKELALLQEQFDSEKKDKEIFSLTIEKQKLESDKQINTLLLKTKQDSLNIAQSEKEKIKLENEKFLALNLFNEQQLELIGNEKRLQELQNEKDKAALAFQKAESEKKQEQLALRELELKKQKLTKNYFIGSLGLVLVLSFFIYRNYHTRQQLKMLALRNKIASDLHDDVGSTLSSISIFSQMARSQSKETIPALETIGESSRKMLDAMTDIVWTINPENDQFEKIIMRMRSFAYELFGAKQMEYEFLVDEDIENIKLPMQARKNLYLIFKESLNNMVKYAEADKAMVSIKGKKDKLTMMIRDNGKGFDLTKDSNGNGLKNMQKRAAEIGARLWIDSVPGSGTTIKLELAA